jgi:hypothetical protein
MILAKQKRANKILLSKFADVSSCAAATKTGWKKNSHSAIFSRSKQKTRIVRGKKFVCVGCVLIDCRAERNEILSFFRVINYDILDEEREIGSQPELYYFWH